MSRNGNVLATSHVLSGGAVVACAVFVGEFAAAAMVAVWVVLGWGAPRVVWWLVGRGGGKGKGRKFTGMLSGRC